MELNLMGVLCALVSLGSIWAGHVAVRKIEAVSVTLWLPMVGFVGAGCFSLVVSSWVSSPLLQAGLGVFGVFLLWDAVELVRQQRRVQNGRAPANPANPRHLRFLRQPASRATTLNLQQQWAKALADGKRLEDLGVAPEVRDGISDDRTVTEQIVQPTEGIQETELQGKGVPARRKS